MSNTKSNEIPPMTHPLSCHWNQPDRSEILIDDTHALMTEECLKKLPEYSCSNPSGVYPGKMWRRNENFYNPTDKWYLVWYGEEFEDKGVKFVSNNYREIILI